MPAPSTRETGTRGRGRKIALAAILVALVAGGIAWVLYDADAPGAPGAPQARTSDGRAQRLEQARTLASELRRRALVESLGRVPVLTVEVRGAVRSVMDGSGIPGAEVTLASTAGRIGVVSGPDGAWATRVPAGVYRVAARAWGYVDPARAPLERLPGAPALGPGSESALDLAPVVVADSDRGGVDLFLVPGARVHGTVRDGAGDPVAGAVVRGAGFEGLERRIRVAGGTDTAVTGADGGYAIDVPVGPVLLEASHEDFSGLAREEDGLVFAGPGDDIELHLVLSEGCVIAGAVVGPQAAAETEGALERWIGGPPPVDYRPAGRFEAGSFRYATSETGTVRLRAWPWKSAPSQPQDFPCRPGARFEGVVFSVPDTPPDLSGTVVTLDGEPVAGAHIDIMPLDPGGLPQQERADDRGEWAVFAQPAGRYAVSAFVPGEGAAAVRARVPSRDVRLVLSGTGAVQGAAPGLEEGSFSLLVETCRVGDDPWPVVGALFENSPPRVVPVRGGRFLVDDLPACRIGATVVIDGRPRPVSFTVAADQITEIELAR